VLVNPQGYVQGRAAEQDKPLRLLSAEIGRRSACAANDGYRRFAEVERVTGWSLLRRRKPTSVPPCLGFPSRPESAVSRWAGNSAGQDVAATLITAGYHFLPPPVC